MLWRKVVDHNPQFVIFCDKLATKEFIRNRCPDLPLAPTLWVGCQAEEIPADILAGDVFVKANHGCDYNFCIRYGKFDWEALITQSRRWLGSVCEAKGGQWAYSQVKPSLFVEASVGDAGKDLLELHIRASNGKAILGSVMGQAKMAGQWQVYLDPEGNPTLGLSDPEGTTAAVSPQVTPVIHHYLRAVEYARRLSIGVDYARFDFMWNGREMFGGEITVYPAGGNENPANEQTNSLLLNQWNFRQSHFLKSTHTGWTRLYAEALTRRLNGNGQ